MEGLYGENVKNCADCIHRERDCREFPCNECCDADMFIPKNAIALKDSGQRREFGTGAVRDMAEGKGRMDLLPWAAIIEVSKHCERGAVKYGEHNVDKGIPVHSFVDSAFRHLAKHVDGQTDEPHLIAAAWNLLFAIQMEVKHPELNDIPWNRKGNEND